MTIRIHPRGKVLLLGLACAMLGACSGSSTTVAEHATRQEAPPTDAERRAARLLSLTNNSSLDAKSDPYERAVTCIAAIDSLQQRLNDAIGMSSEQKRALAIARRMYERQATAAKAGASSVAPDVERARSEGGEDPNHFARTGVSCLRQLA